MKLLTLRKKWKFRLAKKLKSEKNDSTFELMQLISLNSFYILQLNEALSVLTVDMNELKVNL